MYLQQLRVVNILLHYYNVHRFFYIRALRTNLPGHACIAHSLFAFYFRARRRARGWGLGKGGRVFVAPCVDSGVGVDGGAGFIPTNPDVRCYIPLLFSFFVETDHEE